MIKTVLAVLAFALAAPIASAQQLTLAELFRRPQYADMKISPDGRHIAALVPVNGRQNLAIIEVSPRSARPLTSMSGRDVVQFWWVNDKRILYRTGMLNVRADEFRGGGLFAVDIDAKEMRLLGESADEVRGGALLATFRYLGLVRVFNR